MRLLELNIKNFKGINNLHIDVNGTNLDIYGSNGTGKTSIADAFTWLLTGKASNDINNFSPKPRNEQGNDIHNLNTSVEGIFINDGYRLSLERVLTENWTQKRGSVDKIFSGNKTEYYINSVPVLEKEYIQKVEEMIPIKIIKILSSPIYFSQNLHWEERRKILLDILGNIDDMDIIKSNNELEKLTSVIQGIGIDDYVKMAKNRMALINNALKEIPARIDEATKQIVISDVSVEEKTLILEKLNLQKNNIESEIRDIRDGIKSKELSADYSDINTKLRVAENELKAILIENPNIPDEIIAGKDYHAECIAEAQESMKDAKRGIDRTQQKIEHLEEEYTKEKNILYDGDELCALCGQNLPAEQIAQSESNFNSHKSQRLESLKELIENQKQELSVYENKYSKLTQNIYEHQKSLSDITNQIVELKAAKQQEIAEKSREKQKQINELKELLSAIQIKMQNEESFIEAEIASDTQLLNAITKSIDDIKIDILTLKNNIKIKARINDLEQEENKLAQEYEALQQNIYLCELFVKTKVNLLTDSINNKFQTVSFKLFNVQVNGGISECCEVMCKTNNGLQEWNNANNAAKINAGIEIIDSLAKHFGYELPIFIDNAESVTNIISTDIQLIRLIVFDKDKILRFERI